MCLGSFPEASLELAKADLHGICHVNDTKGIYLHGNCHVNLSCDLVLTWECHVKEPVNQELPQGLPLPYMGIPCKWTLEARKNPPPSPLRLTWEPHVSRDQKVRIYMGLYVNIARFCSRASPHGIPMWISCHVAIHMAFPCGRAFSCGC